MSTIVDKLHENRQIQLAKEILESNGYKVEKNDSKRSESSSHPGFDAFTSREKVSKEGRRLVDKAKDSANANAAWAAIDFLYDFPNAFYDYNGHVGD